MSRINPMLLIDFYKAVHAEMLPKDITKSVSYFTPRMSRVKMWPEVVFFGLQAFIKRYLIEHFNNNFFNKNRKNLTGKYEEDIVENSKSDSRMLKAVQGNVELMEAMLVLQNTKLGTNDNRHI